MGSFGDKWKWGPGDRGSHKERTEALRLTRSKNSPPRLVRRLSLVKKGKSESTAPIVGTLPWWAHSADDLGCRPHTSRLFDSPPHHTTTRCFFCSLLFYFRPLGLDYDRG
ncbi:hypothetical protein PanWU01x14_338950 [Parasponia andersonii]|uniref:Uncharacterized protein n=1 Tax=Parasponia andersonii TaxID=3476 RepID=A0A2P5AEZ7_PARAD|nr:hypothetical protein PanWU01x14_338950 [Parasponia andersonii]